MENLRVLIVSGGRARASSNLGTEHVPAFWRVLARQPRFLAATWAKDRLVLNAGEVDEASTWRGPGRFPSANLTRLTRPT